MPDGRMAAPPPVNVNLGTVGTIRRCRLVKPLAEAGRDYGNDDRDQIDAGLTS